MPIFQPSDWGFARGVAELNYTNPFGSERMALEQQALGSSYKLEVYDFWSMMRGPGDSQRGNVVAITARAAQLADQVRDRLLQGKKATPEELQVYDDLVLYLLFYRFFPEWRGLERDETADVQRSAWERFSGEFDHWLCLPGIDLPSTQDKVHLFSMLYQVFRAFYNIFDCVVGHSRPAADLRCQIWQSIFTHDVRRYRRSLYRNMHEITTLVTGPSGSGKELVAQAIGRSRYIPFNVKKCALDASSASSYIALNVSAFSANLFESELFGYVKGAFTGADANRAGWLEMCGGCGTILLDEIGELEPSTQVKFLRVLQNRQYQRMGESKIRFFDGKLIAATNRDLRREIENGRFREDLYYRLCADVITTPPLAEHLREDSSTLVDLVRFLANRIAPGEEVPLTEQVLSWIERELPIDYAWPGNIRELEQCVRNILIRGYYRPASTREDATRHADLQPLLEQIQEVKLSADELLTRYCRIAYRKTSSYKQAAELLGIDRRTLRARCDP